MLIGVRDSRVVNGLADFLWTLVKENDRSSFEMLPAESTTRKRRGVSLTGSRERELRGSVAVSAQGLKVQVGEEREEEKEEDCKEEEDSDCELGWREEGDARTLSVVVSDVSLEVLEAVFEELARFSRLRHFQLDALGGMWNASRTHLLT